MDKTWHVSITYLIMNLGLIFFLYPGNIIACTEEGHWIPIVLGFSVHLVAIFVFMKGLDNLGTKDFIGLYLGIGKGMPFIFLLPIAVYVLMTIIILVRSLAEIMTIVFLATTPVWAVLLLFLMISTYLSLKGIKSILRTSVMIGIINVPVILFFFSSSFQNVDWRYVFPLLGNTSFLTSANFLESFSVFSGGFLFLGFIQPTVTFRSRNILIAALVLLPFIIFSVYIPLLTFGHATASTFHFPFINALDTISLTWLMFDRITIFLFLSLVSFLMIFLSIGLWSIMRIVNQSFPVIKPPYILFVLPVSIFIVCLAIPNWKDIEKLLWWNTYLRFYILIAVPLSVYFIGLRLKGRSNYESIG